MGNYTFQWMIMYLPCVVTPVCCGERGRGGRQVTCVHCLFTRNHSFGGPGLHSWHLHRPGSGHLAFQKEEEVSWFCCEAGVGGVGAHEDESVWEGSLHSEEPLPPVPTQPGSAGSQTPLAQASFA